MGNLVVSRQAGEIIDLTLPDGTMIELTMIEIRGGTKSRIGIRAPDNVRIDRREISVRRAAEMKPRPCGGESKP